VILDTCYAAGMFKDEASGQTVSPQTQWLFGRNALAAYETTRAAKAAEAGEPLPKYPASNVGFLTACDYYEVSWAGDPYSEFSNYLIEAFGSAEADTDGDQQYSFWEIFSWALPRAQGQTAQAYNQSLLSMTVAARGSAGGSTDTWRYNTDPMPPTPEPMPSTPGLCGAQGGGLPMLMTVGVVGLVGFARSARLRRKR